MTIGFQYKKIKLEQSLGDRLKLVRKRKKINLEEAERQTKVSLHYLQALENNQFSHLPAKVYVVGFLRRYAEFLDLNPQELIKKYHQESTIQNNIKLSIKKQNSKLSTGNVLKPSISDKWIKTPKFIITPKLIISSLMILLVLSILGYIWYQVKSFAVAPPLDINLDSSEIAVKVESISIGGQTDPGAVLKINNEEVKVDSEGKFYQEIKLVSGLNAIEISARNKANKETKKTLKILAEFEENK